MNCSGTPSLFAENIEQAVKALQAEKYAAAQESIRSAMLENEHAPEVHNLLGALAELTGDLSLAGKHYRAAYALDPTYKPARRNLERITSFSYRVGDKPPDLGDKPENEEIVPYVFEYDDKHLGYLRKKEHAK